MTKEYVKLSKCDAREIKRHRYNVGARFEQNCALSVARRDKPHFFAVLQQNKQPFGCFLKNAKERLL